ncbi:helix-turn-helix transcriptional regulator [Exiguobacterium sp. s95]|uniref:helix-turn-helix domain-containing protein n=1 Tax=Exiguobacterium sp. s95 TaxID=2751211 RepID=UPI003339A174
MTYFYFFLLSYKHFQIIHFNRGLNYLVADSYKMFPNQLQNVREIRKLSSKEAAHMCHVHPSTWSLYESGRRSPSLDVFIRICKTLEVSADTLLSLNIKGENSSNDNSKSN